MEVDLKISLSKEYLDNYIDQNDGFFLVDIGKFLEKIKNGKFDIDPKDGYKIINLNDIANDEFLE